MSSYAVLTIALPGLIPSNTSTYTRQSAYSIATEISTISSSFVEKFDCFSSQEVIMFPDMIRLNLPINASKVHCAAKVTDFIGDFDSAEYTVQIQEDPNFLIGQSVSFVFKNILVDFSDSTKWLSCSTEADPSTCQQRLEKVRTFKTRTAFIMRTFYKNGFILRNFKTESESRFSRIINTKAKMNESMFCFHTTDIFKDRTDLQIRVQIVAGYPLYSEIGHEYVLDIRGQIEYPNIEQKYCFVYELDSEQQNILNHLEDQDDVTGVISFFGIQIAVYEVEFTGVNQKTNYMYIAAFIAIFICAVFVSTQIYRESRL